MKVLVTGSGGFVGGSFGRHAALAGHEVLGISRAHRPEAGWPGVHAQADVSNSNLAKLISAFRPDLLLHAAGAASVGASLVRPLDDLRAAVVTWANVLDSVRCSGVRPLVIFPSSAAIYGDAAALPVAESAPTRPISPLRISQGRLRDARARVRRMLPSARAGLPSLFAVRRVAAPSARLGIVPSVQSHGGHRLA